MPTLAQRQKTKEIRAYFQQNYTGSTRFPESAIRDDIMSRFGISQGRWYGLRPSLKKLKPLTSEGQGTIIESPVTSPAVKADEIIIPNDLTPDAKIVINKLLGRNNAMADDMRAMQVEISLLRAQLAVTTKKLDAAKSLACDAIKSM